MSDRRREEEEESEFKVNDRRQFTNEGERRKEEERASAKPVVPPSAAPPEAPQAEVPSTSLPMVEEEPHSHEDHSHIGPIGFEHLVMYLATSAMYHLGLDPNSAEESPNVDLPAAKQTIDLLDVLQQKTVGNLSDQEKRMIEGSIYELRMVFVEINKRRQAR